MTLFFWRAFAIAPWVIVLAIIAAKLLDETFDVEDVRRRFKEFLWMLPSCLFVAFLLTGWFWALGFCK